MGSDQRGFASGWVCDVWTDLTSVRLDWRFIGSVKPLGGIPRAWWLLAALLVSLAMWAGLIWLVVALVF